MADPPPFLEETLGVTARENRQSFAQAAERILSLSEEQRFYYKPEDLGEALKEGYFRLVALLIRAQETPWDERLREQVRETVESLAVSAINFHLNFFQPSLLGTADRGAFRRLVSQMKKIFAAKNADYGNAFRFWGVAGLTVRIGDKYFRLMQLAKKAYKRRVSSEALPDTALDLANYCLLLLMLLEEGRSLKLGE